MTERYYAPPIKGEHARLDGTEAHHLIHVMRASPGDRVVLFDGSGAEFLAEVESVGRSQVELTLLERHQIDRELSIKLTLAVALPKGDRQKWLIEKAVELGVARLIPLATSRSVAQPVAKALKRLRRSVIEASKQSGRNRLMEIAEPQAWDDFLASGRETECRWLAHPSARMPDGREAVTVSGQIDRLAGVKAVFLAVGPEGGFSDEEVSTALDCGWQAVDLGERIMRIETAALFLAAIVSSMSAEQ